MRKEQEIRHCFLRSTDGKSEAVLTKPVGHLMPLNAQVSTPGLSVHCAKMYG